MNREMKNGNTKKLSTKIVVLCILFSAVMTICMGCVGYFTFRNSILERYKTYAETVLNLALSGFDGEDMKKCIESMQESEAYLQARDNMDRIKEFSEIEYLYALYFPDAKDPENVNFVMNATRAEEWVGHTEAEVRSALGEYGTDSFDKPMMQEFWNAFYQEHTLKTGYVINNTAEYGYQMTAYKVLADAKGNGVCIIATDISMRKINDELRSYLCVLIVAGVILLLLFLLLFLSVLEKNIIRPVTKISESTADFVEQTMHSREPEELQYRSVPLSSKDEMQILSEGLNLMTAKLKEYMVNLKTVAAEKERIGAELSVATQIQSSMLPNIFPAFPERKEFDIYATMEPAKEVGGDFYDFFMVDDSHLAFVIADVSGKGVPAALFMVITKTLIKNHMQLGETPAQAFTGVNQTLCENNDTGMFVTAWLGLLDLQSGELTFVNAGHNPPLLRKKDGEFSYLKLRTGFVLAGMEGIKYREAKFLLEPGDTLYLYTDGVTEAMNPENKLYGEERLQAYLNTEKDRALEEILHGVREDVNDFVREALQFDDITMLGLRMNFRE